MYLLLADRTFYQTKVEPPLSGHPRGTGKWPLNGDWPLDRGSSQVGILFSRHIILFTRD